MIGRSAGASDRQELFIFVTSTRPDPYVNVLVHALRSRPISAVHYIAIREHGYSAEQENDRLLKITSGIHTHLQSLADQYSDRNEGWAAIYEECLDKLDSISTTTEVVVWTDLDSRLRAFSANAVSIFDVTALKKNLLVEVVALLLSWGCTRVYIFELLKVPTHNEADLIHALKPSEFSYRSIAESKNIEVAQKRILANSATLRTLLVTTGIVALFVLVVQLFFGSTWLQTVILAVGTITSIAGFVFLLLRNAR
jgi:hypothetical protein